MAKNKQIANIYSQISNLRNQIEKIEQQKIKNASYKVGDTVKIISNDDKQLTSEYNKKASKFFIGKIVKIIHVYYHWYDNTLSYKMDLRDKQGLYWVFTDDEFEKIN